MSAQERWCCPNCGTLNEPDPDEGDGGFSARGWCQGDTCVTERARFLRRYGASVFERMYPPEILHIDIFRMADA